MPDPILTIGEVIAGYDELTILRSVSFAVARATWTTIIGANGAGKSTLLNVIAGTVPCRSGVIAYDGDDVTGVPPIERLRSGIGFVPQGRCNFPLLTVKENIKLGAYTRRLDRGHLADEIDAVVARFPALRERWRVRAGNLSGGEQQMLEMAMVLMARPRLLLIDEPSLGLSPKATGDVFDIVRGLVSDGLTVVMVEQNAQAALERCDYALVLELGRVGLFDRAAQVLGHPEIRRMFLGL
jgi:branched-chain amino acid transport system ATP-binding protein